MKKNYDLKQMNWKPNPYLKHLKKSVTIRFDQDVVEYFKALSEQEGLPYQTLMDKFLRGPVPGLGLTFCAKEKSLH